MPAYEPDNLFDKILNGTVPSIKVFEDEIALAFMDIMPRTEGHILVVPKAPARGLLDLDPALVGPLMLRVQKVARAAVDALGADGLTIHQHNEAAGGQVIFHMHVHILPRWDGVDLKPPGVAGDRDALTRVAEKIRAKLA